MTPMAAPNALVPPNSDLLSALSLEVSGTRPLYAQLADELRGLVEAHFHDGDLFYSEKTLMERLPVSQITIRRALRELTTEGLLAPGRGRGTTIRKRSRFLSSPAPPAISTFRQVKRHDKPAKKILGIFLLEPLLQLSEHSRVLMLEFQRQANAHEIEIRFHDSSDTTRLSQIIRSISGSSGEEAFVLHTPSDLTHLLYHALDNMGYRSVAMEGIAPDYPGQIVATDSVEAVRVGMDYLYSLGHRHVVLLVNEPASEYNVQDKMQSFEQYVEQHEMDPLSRIVLCDNFIGGDSYHAAYQHMEDALSGSPSRPTALFTVSDPGAWAAIKWCSQQGIRVPEDLSVLGFEDAQSSRYLIPAVSTVAHPDALLVASVLDVLWGTSTGGPRKLLIPPKLVIRESTAPPPSAEKIA